MNELKRDNKINNIIKKYEKKLNKKTNKQLKKDNKKQLKILKRESKQEDKKNKQTKEFKKLNKQKIKLENKELRLTAFPFSKGEEIFNAVVHVVGASFAIVAIVLMIIKSAGNLVHVISSVVFGVCMLILFTMSAIYHFLRKNKAKKVFRIIDQCSIFLLIAGTYTPFCLIVFKDSMVGYLMLGFVWAISLLGITLNAVNMRNKAVMVFSQIAYVMLGWCVVFAISPLIKALVLPGIIWLVAGGLFYTGGIMFFAFGRKVPYFHPIWHLFVFLGAFSHFISIYFYVL